jgi:hypothetical protein
MEEDMLGQFDPGELEQLQQMMGLLEGYQGQFGAMPPDLQVRVRVSRRLTCTCADLLQHAGPTSANSKRVRHHHPYTCRSWCSASRGSSPPQRRIRCRR